MTAQLRLSIPCQRMRRWALMLALSSSLLPVSAGTLTLSNVPLFNSTSADVFPNIMFLMDSSGSMAWDFLPDYINGSQSCFDSKTEGTTSLTNTRPACYVGDPPFMSPDFNAIYYNPDFTYSPGYDGTLSTPAMMPTQSITSVSQDPYNQQRHTQLTKGNSGGTIDLTTNYPDRVWCNSSSGSALDAVNCRTNTVNYDYPNASYGYVPTSTSSGEVLPDTPSGSVPAVLQTSGGGSPPAYPAYKLGSPYYWRIIPTEYCSDLELKNCVDWTSSSTNVGDHGTNMYCKGPDRSFSGCQVGLDATHRYPAKCNSSECVVPGTGTTYSIPAPLRFCKPDSSGTTTFPLLDCQGSYDSTTSHYVPKFLGYVSSSVTGAFSTGSITITDATPGLSITGVSVTSLAPITTTLTSTTYTVPFGATPETVASGIKALLSGSGYSTAVSGRTIRISSTTAGTTADGTTILVTAPAAGGSGTKATSTLTVGSGTASVTEYRLGPICVGTIHGSYPSQTCDKTTSGDNLGAIISPPVDVNADLSTPAGQATAAAQIAAAISSYPSGGYTATASGSTVTITAPTVGNLTASIGIMGVELSATPGAGMITVNGLTSGVSTYGINSIQVATTPVPTTISTGPVTVTADLTTSSGRAAAAAAIAASIGAGYTATPASNVVNLAAPGGSSGNGTLSVTGRTATASGAMSVASTSGNTRTYKITSIVAGTTTIAGAVTFTQNLSTPAGVNAAATAIKNAISGAYVATCTGGASCTSNTVNLTASTPGSAANATLSVGTAAAATTVKVTVGGSPTSSTSVTAIALSGCTDTSFNTTNILSGSTSGSSSTSTIASRIVTKVKSSAPVSASASSSIVTFTPKSGKEGGVDGCSLSISSSGGSPTFTLSSTSFTGNDAVPFTSISGISGGTDPMPTSVSGISGGSSRTALPASTAAFSSGTNASGPIPTIIEKFSGGAPAGTETRIDVGLFLRCDIKSGSDCAGLGVDKFPRSANRTDCADATFCTLAEEQTNFANWYAYYRTRMQAMKTSASLAFSALGTNYRVGFSNIQVTSTSSSDFLSIGDFATTQVQSWYTALFRQQPNNSTPLRSALSRVGKMYAHSGDFALADPVKYACQQNVTILTTDGYWNSDSCSDVTKLDGVTQIGQQDGAPTTSRTAVPAEMWDGDLGGTCLNSSDGPSSTETLADVAYYYSHTDLRTGALGNCSPGSGTEADVCDNSVSTANPSEPRFQHMATYTLGLGVSGTLRYQSDYDTASSGAYFDIKNGLARWPKVTANTLTTVDDLWHAGVNGFGRYFSASNPARLRNNLSDALSSIKASIGAGAAAATSSQALSSSGGGSKAYVASYKTQDWYGNLEARSIDAKTALISASANWCASSIAADSSSGVTACVGSLREDSALVTAGKVGKVAPAADTRNIYLLDTTATSGSRLRSFNSASLTGTELTYFAPCPSSGSISALTQCTLLPSPTKAAATADTLIKYLRGQTGMEMEITTNTYQAYRHRKAVLGDVVASPPRYVAAPFGSYTDPGYIDFVTAHTSRTPMVYVGANDGMLHAFAAETDSSGLALFQGGDERWAYIPAQMLPKMRNLADQTYKDNHLYFVNGPIVVSDVCFSNCDDTSHTPSLADWHTILVSGYGGGSKGYFAIDVTDPANPKGLWEINDSLDADIGNSFGNPIITKRSDGKWTILLTSGYNNGGGGSGEGVLFVVEPETGHILTKISNKSGSSASPSGLAKIESFIPDALHDNTASYVYGGDLNGNVWRFNLKVGSESVVKVATLADTSGVPEPISVKPIVTTLDDSSQTPYIIVGTGLMLQVADKSNTQLQSIYAFADTYDTLCKADTATTGKCVDAAIGEVTRYAYPGPSLTTAGTSSEVPSTYATVGNCAGTSTTSLSASCPKGARNQLPGQTLVDDGEDSLGRPQRKSVSVSGSPDKTPAANGCYINLPDPGERVNVDPVLINGELVVASNVPESSACSAGGHSWLGAYNYKTCNADMSIEVAKAMAVGLTVVKTETGAFVPIVTESNNTQEVGPTVPQGLVGFQGKRSGWRILGD